MNPRTTCKGSSTCAVDECGCRCRKGDRFTMCRCCEARLSDRERRARTALGWVDLHCDEGRPIGPDPFASWEAFNQEMLRVVGSKIAAERGARVVKLPDLARMRTLSDRVRTSSDDEVADLLTTDDGKWLFTEAGPYLAADVLRRLATIMAAGIPDGAFWRLLGVTPERMGGSHG